MPATQLGTQSTTELATPPAFSTITHLANQLVTQKGTTQLVNKIAVFKETLKIAISTPLPKAFQYRGCLAEFLFNS